MRTFLNTIRTIKVYNEIVNDETIFDNGRTTIYPPDEFNIRLIKDSLSFDNGDAVDVIRTTHSRRVDIYKYNPSLSVHAPQSDEGDDHGT
ncbi:unnamed protein product [Arabis nemorensis]|uniref:Uncharacterized protein n=1 Tax=Arabis nemorensis TaxID=586526 RepID=A0A565BS62_9BRAS|nr:unnamed protein product [Arabis nemorensis]